MVLSKSDINTKQNHHIQLRQAKLRESYGDSLFVQNFFDQTFDDNSIEDITSNLLISF